MRNILIIAGGSSIGEAIISEAKHRKYHVVSTSREGKNDFLVMDVRDENSVSQSIEKSIEILGEIDAVIYTPAITDMNLLHASDMRVWAEVFDVNLYGAVRVAKKIMPHFLKKRSGSILFISSTAANRGVVGSGAYASSKSALNTLSKNISIEYGRFNIRSNAILPGYVDGGMLKNLDEKKSSEIKKKISLKRFATPSEIGQLSLDIIENQYLTGSLFEINGGESV
ncbi:SDR family NAD(P)-dependent oxidoreductase [Chitinibacter sp. ZOR0017]|uniref:SDR family NAD(P)-dependent oxidoreductase n=1 Tax=Chitinibacter sp. ZOR0017 TaxID=1339254 RepID=UPI0009DEFAAD|nr:SDR family oxidoreductase [Chitinibacter sp. ZOR0017]